MHDDIGRLIATTDVCGDRAADPTGDMRVIHASLEAWRLAEVAAVGLARGRRWTWIAMALPPLMAACVAIGQAVGRRER